MANAAVKVFFFVFFFSQKHLVKTHSEKKTFKHCHLREPTMSLQVNVVDRRLLKTPRQLFTHKQPGIKTYERGSAEETELVVSPQRTLQRPSETLSKYSRERGTAKS